MCSVSRYVYTNQYLLRICQTTPIRLSAAVSALASRSSADLTSSVTITPVRSHSANTSLWKPTQNLSVGSNTPVPDDNPLDQCNGHGTHVAVCAALHIFQAIPDLCARVSSAQTRTTRSTSAVSPSVLRSPLTGFSAAPVQSLTTVRPISVPWNQSD